MSEYLHRVKQLDKQLSSRLSHIDIELTERCNNNCIHCYINQPEEERGIRDCEMDTEFVKSLLKQAADLGCLSVRFTGGEPLLREDFKELYLFARRLGLKVLIFTNARLIDSDLAMFFARIPPGKPIEVSVYGMDAASYDSVAGVKGAFEQFWNGINNLREYSVPFVVKQSLLPQNRAEIPEFEAFAATLPHMEDHNPSYSMNFDLRARRDNEAKNQVIRHLRISPKETLTMITREPEKYVKEMRQFAAKFMGPSGDKIFSCGAGHGACIDAYGHAQMCLLLRHPDTVCPLDVKIHRDNHSETDLQPLEYALKEYFPQVRKMRSHNPDYLRRCAVCFLKGFCNQCPAKSWEEHGTLDTPVDYLCEVAHTQAIYLGLLHEGENSWEIKPEIWRLRLKEFTGNS